MLHGIALAVVALLCGAGGLLLPLPWAVPCWWGAGAFGAVAVGYLGAGPAVLGKRKTGALSPLAVALLLPFYLFSWGIWRLRLALSSERASDEVAPGLHVGRRVTADELPEHVSVVVDLTAELSEAREIRDGLRYVCLPSLDATAPHGQAAVDAVDTLAPLADDVIFVHCAFGHGRSVAFAAALMLARGVAPSVDAALATIKAARPAISLGPAQRAWAARWERERGA